MKFLKNLFSKHYWLFLVAVVLFSYGQTLGMGIWKDDNAIFFKFQHIYENAGYFGKGILGEGPYIFSITPYYPIYKIFGDGNLLPYHLLVLVFYFLLTLAVYYLFSSLFSRTWGKISAFLFACGYIGIEGFSWLAYSMVAQVSLILLALTLLSYNLFGQRRKPRFYLLAVLFYWLAVFLTPVRSHFFIFIIVAFELIYLGFKKFPKTLLGSLVRLVPFIYIFYHYFLAHADNRATAVSDFFIALVKGDFTQTYNIFASFSNLFFSTGSVEKVFQQVNHLGYITLLLLIPFFYFLIGKKPKRNLWTLVSVGISAAWFFASKRIFNTLALSPSPTNLYIVFIGGVVLLTLFFLFLLIDKDKKKHFLFCVIWLLVSVGAYAAYEPTSSFQTTHRYLANSLLPLTGLVGILYLNFTKRPGFFGKLLSSLIILWGIGNAINSFNFLKITNKERSAPVANFYRKLKAYLPAIKKGDLVYFDVAKNAQSYFGYAFSVSSMPETTALAWRYGVDRYDFYRVTDFPELVNTVKTEKVPIGSIHAFYYSKDGLRDTTSAVRNYFSNGGNVDLTRDVSVSDKDGEVLFNFFEPVETLMPIELTMTLQATPPTINSFPYSREPVGGAQVNGIYKSDHLRKLAIQYGKSQENLYKVMTVTTTSDWQERVAKNLIDRDPNTVWQANRIMWSAEKSASLTMDLKTVQIINRFVWINGFGNNTPIKYTVSLSTDSINWHEVENFDAVNRVDTSVPQVVEFTSQPARYVRMTIYKSLNGDSPGIAEAWGIPANFGELNLGETQKFLGDPFLYVPDAASFQETLAGIEFTGRVQVAWQGDKEDGWVTSANSQIKVSYNGKNGTYRLVIPTEGTKIERIRLSGTEIPGEILLREFRVRHPTLIELLS